MDTIVSHKFNVVKVQWYPKYAIMKKDRSEDRTLIDLATMNGKTLKKVSIETGIPYNTLKAISQKKRQISLERAVLLCRALNCSLRTLAKTLKIDVTGVLDDTCSID